MVIQINIWGDGVIDSLISIGFNNIISYAAGEFYVDFLDKVIVDINSVCFCEI